MKRREAQKTPLLPTESSSLPVSLKNSSFIAAFNTNGISFGDFPVHFLKRVSSFALIAPLAVALSACSGGNNTTLPGLKSTSVASSPRPHTASSIHRPSADANGQIALSADSLPGDHDASNNFIDSIGVNTKIDVGGINYPGIKAALLNLGVRHIRDSFDTQNINNYENNLNDLANNGIHSVLGLTITPDANNNAKINVTGVQAVAYLQAGHYVQAIEAIEGINEPDVNQIFPNGPSPVGWVGVTQTQQQALYAGIQTLTAPAKRIPVFGPSVAVNSGDLTLLGDLSQSMDYGNVHDYSGGYDLPGSTIVSVLSLEQIISGTKPVVATENGYSTGTTGQGMPDAVMLDYAGRLFFKQFTNNVKRTLWYEFTDENNTPNDYWHNAGLVTTALVPKLAYVGLRNIISLLKDQTPYKPRTALNFSFGGQTQFENIEDLLLQKNDGSFWLVVWRDVGEWNPANTGSPGSYPVPLPASVANSLNFLGTYVSSITEYVEDNSGAMSSTPVSVTAGSTAQISIGARPEIFAIVPGVAPVVAGAPTIANPAAHWSLDEASGTVAADSVAATGNMTVPSNTKTSWLTGEYNSGLGFNGTQAITSASFMDTSQSYSATAWLQMNSLSGYQAAVTVNGVNFAAFALDFTPQSNISYTTYVSDSNAPSSTRIGSTIVPVIGKWYPVAATYNGTTRLMSLYINGALQSTGTAKAVFNGTGGTEIGSMLQGGIGHWQWWNGGVDEVNLYPRELTAAEVKTMAGQ